MKQFYLYSATTNSFYPVSAPADAVQITEEKHTELFNGQSEGKAIKPNKKGFPINVDQGKSYEIWDRESESWIVDDELYQEHLKEEKQRKIQSLHDDLETLERDISRLERIRDRNEDEETKLQQLYDESTQLYRDIQVLEETE
ncbi:hypothetical protein GCM10007161_05400 [Ignatzschineria indica]|uniref:Uncharacterized protein n=1 Tax=Ignatzschineria indica TaxID=472583 RepID=A0A2U2AN06_9GAMM|nr:tail fiber assembly protein [Ignatzschineria indica]PWD84527.1 hypothetical protein DC082_03035 [Ignatzschineria indica]GGZ77172.1 hypothetical protein GCM10007161_05400 [Ignatzschineria indica]